MDKIASWCKFICLFSVLSSAALLILPESKIKNCFKMLLSFVIVYSLVLPLYDAEPDFSRVRNYLKSSNNVSISENMSGYENYPLIIAAETETEEYFGKMLSDIGSEGSCEAVFELHEDKLTLTEITFYGSIKAECVDIITQEVGRIYGEEALIIFSGERYEN